jgi:imidazole glycerol-phosphate synthase subunit HisF
VTALSHVLKIRIIPTLLYRNLGLVKGVRFDSWRRVGSAMQAVRVYNMREVDELVFLDIAATRDGRSPDFELVDELADECFMPLAVGGGVRSLADVRRLLRVGADKVVLNSAAVATPSLVTEASQRFGAQCVVVSIDVKRQGAGGREVVWTHSGTVPTNLDPIAWARRVEELGAGEVLLCSVDRDGTMEGYDTRLLAAVSEAVALPVIASGGAGTYQHMADALREAKVSALAAASMFHFTEQTPLGAKRYLRDQGFSVRL